VVERLKRALRAHINAQLARGGRGEIVHSLAHRGALKIRLETVELYAREGRELRLETRRFHEYFVR